MPTNMLKSSLQITLNIVSSVTYFLGLRNVFLNFLFIVDVILYQVKMLMFYNAQTINSTFNGKKWDIQ